jgi:hypothetical protein
MNNSIVYENSVPEKIFRDLQAIIFSDSFPWFYSGTTLGERTSEDNKFDFSFFHNAFYHDTGYSFIGEKLDLIFRMIVGLNGDSVDTLLRIRIGLITNTDKTVIHTPHIDFPFKHKTALLYLNDTDGDTYIWKDKYNESIDKTEFDNFVRSKNCELLDKVSPKENRLVVFDGFNYHSSSSPTTCNKRVVVTFNYV